MGQAARRQRTMSANVASEIIIRDAAPGEGRRVTQLLGSIAAEDPSVADRIDHPETTPPGLWPNLVAEAGGIMVGAVIGCDNMGNPRLGDEAGPNPEAAAPAAAYVGTWGDLRYVAVHPKSRRRGIGHRLVEALEQRFAAAGYEFISGAFPNSNASQLKTFYVDAGWNVANMPGFGMVAIFPSLMIPILEEDCTSMWKQLNPGRATVVDATGLPRVLQMARIQAALRTRNRD